MIVRRALLAAAIAVALSAPVAAAPPQYYYLNPKQVDLTVLLPPPPLAASPEEQADEAQVAAAVSARNPQQMTEAEEASKRSVFFFASSVGPNFTAARCPLTARFFKRIQSDVKNLIDSAKIYWNRPRPDGTQKRRGSYPSGHAAFASSSAIVLSLLLPQRREAIFSQARIFAENRILLGLHYPSDVASGWTAGTLAAYVMMRDPAFSHDFKAAKSELQRANL